MEIFAVAAVGFVLRHDVKFKKYFLKKFADIDGIEEDVENFEPSIQAADCTDLKLENLQSRILVVLEFKVWAKLQPKQNPWCDDARKFDDSSLPFWSEADKGYGYQLGQKNYDQFSTIYYIVVQQNGVLRDDKQIKLTPERSVVGLHVGDPIRLTEADFERLSAAFFAELERRFL